MKRLFGLIGLAAAAIALALLAGSNHANVVLFWPPYRVDVSFNLALAALLLLFVLGHAALRAAALLRRLPQQARRWRKGQAERAAIAALLEAIVQQSAGRFVRAQSAAQLALAQLAQLGEQRFDGREQVELLAHLLAAESAQALGNADARERSLQAALAGDAARDAGEARAGLLMKAAGWALDQNDDAQAARWLDELPQGVSRRFQALRLRLRLARLRQDHEAALDIARLLVKHRAYSGQASRSLLNGIALDALRAARDPLALLQVWRGLEAGERATPDLALAALEGWERFGREAAQASDAEQRFIEEALQSAWAGQATMAGEPRRRLLLRFESALPRLGADWLSRIEQAQQSQPNDAGLQYLAGQACLQRQLWGKAAPLLAQASLQLDDAELARRSWCALARLAEQRGDEPAAQQAWKRAAQL